MRPKIPLLPPLGKRSLPGVKLHNRFIRRLVWKAVERRRFTAARLIGDPRSTGALIVAAIRDASAQFASLLQLARIELRSNLRAVATLVALFGGALLLVLVSLVLLLIALRDAIAVLFGSDALAGLIVALPFLAATAILLRLGFRRMSLRAAGDVSAS